ncbi:MAG: 2OG-Fe(II) oxygenase [Polyangiaceae bacterium]|nr:2OG-Fe(II) oxygenase [Polyangiaceae bacterium]
MLDKLRQISSPFPFFVSGNALPPATCSELEAIFGLSLPWHDHDSSFYEVSNCDVSDKVAPRLLTQLTRKVSKLTDLELRPHVAVTAQLMAPGQRVGAHSDRPLVGFEAVRLVVQLNRDWCPTDGGVLLVHPNEDDATSSHEFPPDFNTAFGFVMRPGSHHSVTPTTNSRRSVVFNFWHVGNNEHLGDHIAAVFKNMKFSDLPRAVQVIAERAEQQYPEQVSYRASVVAMALMRWGYPPDIVAAGYETALASALPDLDRSDDFLQETTLAVALAQWAGQLYLEDYDIDYWERMVSVMPLAKRTAPDRLQDFCHAIL